MMMIMMSLLLQRCHPRVCNHPCSQRLPEVRRFHSVVMFLMEIGHRPDRRIQVASQSVPVSFECDARVRDQL